MNLNREAIINRLKKNGFKKFYLGSPFQDGPEEDYETVADEILSLLQPNKDTPPQLNKHDVSGSKELLLQMRGRIMKLKAEENIAANQLAYSMDINAIDLVMSLMEQPELIAS